MNRYILYIFLLLSINSFSKDLKQLDKQCIDGNIQSCWDIGFIYDKADIVKYNPHKVAYYYDKACNGANKGACHNLGVLYSEGSYGKNGLKPDIQKSKKAYSMGCDFGDKDSCQALEFLDKQNEE